MQESTAQEGVAGLLAATFPFTLANKCIALYCYVPQVARLSRSFPASRNVSWRKIATVLIDRGLERNGFG